MPGRERAFRWFALDARDLDIFNRWLCVTRMRAVGALALLLVALRYAAPDAVYPIPVLWMFAAAAVLSLAAPRAATLRRRPVLSFLLQNVFDFGAITVGVAVAVRPGVPALLLHMLYTIVLIPGCLVSVPFGIAITALATVVHTAIVGVRFGADAMLAPESLVPSVVYFAVAQQCLFYGRHIDEKGRVLRALVEVARTLGATAEAPDLLARVTRTLRALVDADWVGTFLVDRERRTFRLIAVNGGTVREAGLAQIDFPVAGWRDVTRLVREDLVVAGDAGGPHVPAPFTGGAPLSRALLAALRRDDALVGFVAVGWQRKAPPASAERLLTSVAEHAAIVLKNAQMLEDLRLASQLKSEFVGAVSHELRSPLNVILGYTEMLREGALGAVNEEQGSALERTHRQAIALLEMITALLDLNRLEAGRLPVEGVEVDVARLLDELREQIPDAWRQPGVALRVEAEADLPAIVTDPGKLKTVLRNLVHNALKFTTRGYVVVRATAGVEGGIAFAVEDTGCGIPADALPYVFEMFRQVPGSAGGGVGLGLHLVRRLVDALGGTVEVRSVVGCGTSFRVTMPARDAGRMPRVA